MKNISSNTFRDDFWLSLVPRLILDTSELFKYLDCFLRNCRVERQDLMSFSLFLHSASRAVRSAWSFSEAVISFSLEARREDTVGGKGITRANFLRGLREAV